jgi:hypothetical protein
MMIDGKGVLLALLLLAVGGFIGGAFASIWLGPVAMLWGAVGLPIGTVVLIVLLLILGVVFNR